MIHEPVFGSVHSPMSLTVDCSFDKTQAIKPPIPAPPRFIWDPTKREQFIGVLRSKLGKFTKMCSLLVNTSCTKGETMVLKEFTDILYESALTCFRMAKPKKNLNKKRMKNQYKPWYNNSCQGLKKRLLNQARLLKKNPKDPYMRGAFISCKKEYRKSIKENKRIFEINKLDEIQSLTNNPKKFWKKLKGLLGKSKSHSDNHISPETWVSHFSSLDKKDPELVETNKTRCSYIESCLGYLEKKRESPCPIMDKEFSLSEILTGIKSLKKGKASALDAISNDILHCAAKTGAVPVLQAIFNNLIKFQFFPTQWATGIIVPLHKSGGVDDPNNYRGITLNSCISKLFTLLLNTRLTAMCEEKEIISYNQIGFRKGFRTSDHVFTLKTLIDDAFHKKTKAVCLFCGF